MVIDRIGLVSSLGSRVQAAAAFRAGITRFQAARDFTLFEPGDESAQPAIISPVVGNLTLGFVGVGRLVALAMAALRDLFDDVAVEWRRVSQVFMVVPDPLARGIVGAGGDLETEDERVGWLGGEVLRRTLINLGLPAVPCASFGGGHDGFIGAAVAVQQHLVSGSRVVILSVDSLAAPECLDLILAEGRLKTRTNAMGTCPGEAGVALLVSETATGPGMVLSGFGLVDLGTDPAADSDAGMRSLQPALQALTEHAGPFLAIIDHAGQVKDAQEWGMTLTRMQAHGIDTGRMDTWFPASSFGEVGVAFAGLSLALAFREMPAGRVPGTALLKLVGDDGRYAGALVTYGTPAFVESTR